MTSIARVEGRSAVRVRGVDAESFLQGLLSNDVRRAAAGRAIYAGLCTPQGKLLFDLIVFRNGDGFALDCARARELAAALAKYKLRARVEIEDLSARASVWQAWDGATRLPDDALVSPDPRLDSLGTRIVAPGAAGIEANADYETHRLALGVPEDRDFGSGGNFLLECNFEELNGVDFKKGCYVGQELTARMKHKAAARRRMLPVDISGALPVSGTKIVNENGAEAGEIRSGKGTRAIALVRLDRVREASRLTAGGANVTIATPAYGIPALSQGDTP